MFYEGKGKQKYTKTHSIHIFSKQERKKARRKLKKCDLIVVRPNFKNSKPCKNCLKIIQEFGINKVYYSINQGLKVEKASEMHTNHLSSCSRWKQGIED